MSISILVIAAAAAAHGASATRVDAAKAQAEGYAEAQRALAGESEPTGTPASTNPVTPGVPSAGQLREPASPGGQQALNLTCLGAGTANKATAATAWSTGSFSGLAGGTLISGSTSGSTTIFGTRQQGFQDQVDVNLFAGDDRIRLPRTMLPPIHGGEAGWFRLKNVVADARSIRASAAINFLSNPKVYIDRVTGTISISGRAGDYSGQCEAVESDAPAKF